MSGRDDGSLSAKAEVIVEIQLYKGKGLTEK